MKWERLFALMVMVFMAGVVGCGKEVDVGRVFSSEEPPITECAPLLWEFQQPEAVDTPLPVDFLFVVDTSLSLQPERENVAQNIGALVDALPVQADVRMGVMLGHGGASRKSGRLYRTPGTPWILDTRKLSRERLKELLVRRLRRPPGDVDAAGGEALMYSVQKSLQPGRLKELQKLGFYRKEAALSVLFVSDENDLCFRPELHGYTEFPHYVPDPGDWEKSAHGVYCVDKEGVETVNPWGLARRFRRLKRGKPVTLGALVHVNPERVPKGGEDSIGHGFLELTDLFANAVEMELAAPSYVPGLRRMGEVMNRQLVLRTQFDLLGDRPLEGTLAVMVDGSPVPFKYDGDLGAVEIPAKQAGGPGSRVRVSACGVPL